MNDTVAQELPVLADAYAFVGNSLLRPMSQTSFVGLDPQFWEAFPRFGSAAVDEAATRLARWAAAGSAVPEADRVRDVSVEYTRLFVGPPSPVAPPWETMNRNEGVTVGFGEPTFQMRQLLRDAGLELSNENRQYEDHMGIELLYLSELCRRVGADDAEGDADALDPLRAFVREHPLAWINWFAAKVAQDAPDGYYAGLLSLAKVLLELWVR